jgi:hypothetical protein
MGSYSKYAVSNHTQLVKGFMGQTTSFDAALIKSNVLIMGSCELNGEAARKMQHKALTTFLSRY